MTQYHLCCARQSVLHPILLLSLPPSLPSSLPPSLPSSLPPSLPPSLPRAMSVDPERMMSSHHQDPYLRPTSSQSVHVSLTRRPMTDLGFSARGQDSVARPPSSQGFMLDHFMTTLPVLDFGPVDPESSLLSVCLSVCHAFASSQVNRRIRWHYSSNNSSMRPSKMKYIFV